MQPLAPLAHLLIVEDDPDLGMGLEDFFLLKGYAVTHAADGAQALRLLTLDRTPFDLVVLDVMLPRLSGFDVLREVRQQGLRTPVVMLTAKGEETDKLRAFDLGVDDYVTKPFSAEELAARVRAVLSRAQTTDTPMEIYRFGEIEINFSNHTAHRGGAPLKFTALEYDLLRYFIENRGRTISRRQLLSDVWNISPDVTTRTIDRHIVSLRKKIEPDPNNPTHIETVYGIGYKFMS